MALPMAAAASWLRSGPVLISYADIFYRSELVLGLARTSGQLVITYDRAWRDLWTRRFADPLTDAETFRVNAAGQLVDIGAKTTRIEDIEGQYMGLLKFTPPAWNTVEAPSIHSTRPSAIDTRYDRLVAPFARRKSDPDRHTWNRRPVGRNRHRGRRVAVSKRCRKEGELVLDGAP